MTASVSMVALGGAATALSLRRRDTPAVPATFAYFTFMEGLQAAGYGWVDQCGSGANQAITVLSYLHITFQPFFINAFAMALLAGGVAWRMRVAAYLACFVSATVMLLQLYPFAWAGPCKAGTSLCGELLCTVSGNWHLAWDIPYNGLVPALEILPGLHFSFPTYILAAFGMPLLYGAWRFVVFHALAGPILASLLTSNPNEMPAIWCLFSIALVIGGLSPWVRGKLYGSTPPLRRREAG
ncbi:DUF5765 domain-containing protein [Falsiroseomonas oryzae]|uniref:DUF5765 domain-containing protein n=1 Tax=Falsiroseomonas oryzae TaxID=2766473 RepID=UPI0022EB1FB2|nr:DUF5765 domain-containing protein [Roseomonas sp. MO-31]